MYERNAKHANSKHQTGKHKIRFDPPLLCNNRFDLICCFHNIICKRILQLNSFGPLSMIEEAEVRPVASASALYNGEGGAVCIIGHYLTEMAHSILMLLGVRKDRLPSAETTLGTLLLAGVLSYVFHSRRRKQLLSRELEAARAELAYLQEKLLREVPGRQETKKEIRIFMDGAFDLMHFGHANAFRLARSLGTFLVVGVNSDESIAKCKGAAPLLNDEERLTMVKSCKFVDEVLPNCPYVMDKKYLDYVIKRYKIDFVVHGSDPCIWDGQDVYATAKDAGKYRSIPRTEGVSTTDIIGRMLLMTKEHHCRISQEDPPENGSKNLGSREFSLPTLANTQSKFLTTSRMLKLFSAGVKAPTKDMRIIYVDGAWDLFHPGHCRFLKAAREVSFLETVRGIPLHLFLRPKS